MGWGWRVKSATMTSRSSTIHVAQNAGQCGIENK